MHRVPPDKIPVVGLPSEFAEPRYVKIACPKCGSRDLNLIEMWETSIEWTVTDGWMDRSSGNKAEGRPTGVMATCKACRYDWKPRKATQIGYVLEAED